MAAPVNTAPLSNTPANTNVVDADQLNTKFDRLFDYLTAGVEVYVAGSIDTADIADDAITAAKLAVVPACLLVDYSQSIPTGVDTALTFGSESFDTTSMHSTSSNTSRITIATAGIYRYSAYASFDGVSPFYLKIANNGSPVDTRIMQSTSTITVHSLGVTGLISLAASDYLEVMARHGHGSSRNVYDKRFEIEYVGAAS
jgi:hypothetical protein